MPWKKFNPCNPCCGGDTTYCNCTLGTYPTSFSVTIAGISNNVCTMCNELNATYSCSVDAPNSCQWTDYFLPSGCLGSGPAFPLSSSVVVNLTGNIQLDVTLTHIWYTGGIGGFWFMQSDIWSWQKTLSGNDCDITSESVPFIGHTTSYSFGSACQGTPTCIVTAVGPFS